MESVLLLLIPSLLATAAQLALCSTVCPEAEIQSNDGNYSSSYSFHVETLESDKEVQMNIFSRICPNLESVGPRFYRLDVIGEGRSMGEFKKPGTYSNAVLVDEGIEFDGGENPLALFDLPRVYRWKYNKLPQKLCLRLVIKHGDLCEQIVSQNCSEELAQHLAEHGGSGDSNDTVATTPMPTEPPTWHPFLLSLKIKLCVDSNHKLNCTGKRTSATCGTDRRWYKNKCTLRLYKCVYGVDTLQRDLIAEYCEGPAPTSFPTFGSLPPPPPTTPTPVAPCSSQPQDHPRRLRCLDSVRYRPIQCWEEMKSGVNVIECYCVDGLTGGYHIPPWQHTCPSPFFTEPPIQHC